MKKFLLILIILSFILPINGIEATKVITIQNPLEADTFQELIAILINILFTISLVLAPLMIIIGAFYLMVPGEKLENIETGKKIILYTIIGFIIIILARGIIALLKEAFGIE
jgi:hypothetical protein